MLTIGSIKNEGFLVFMKIDFATTHKTKNVFASVVQNMLRHFCFSIVNDVYVGVSNDLTQNQQ